ncbi:MAG: hypothetical protein COB30_000550 [Ectothiorhodospiraceae bacterium]|nr:hypothetical protein [Ectothiorhodospiraceae bacterium]
MKKLTSLNMLNTIKRLLPALLPSWRFFDFIVASPRIQFSLLKTENETSRQWQEFRPRPTQLSFAAMIKRLLWNPEWNESLFMVSCAERLLDQPTQHSEDEILKRIQHDITKNHSDTSAIHEASHLQFRILLINRKGTELLQEIAFTSRIQLMQDER